MSHSLHRYGTIEELKGDYCIYARASRNVNYEGAGIKLQRIFEIFTSEDFVNFGSLNAGCSHVSGLDDARYKEILLISSGIIVTYRSIDAVKKVLVKLKEEDLGISIVVSGLIDDVVKTALECSLRPHTAVLSLGIYGNTQRLPNYEILKITTMCGHSLISANIAQKIKHEVESRQMDAQEGARLIERPCTCGIFNTDKCAKLLKK